MQTAGYNERISFHVAASGMPWNGISGGTNVGGGVWHHVAGVYDCSMAYLYIDGVEDAQLAASGPIGINSDEVIIGGSFPSLPSGYRQWEGMMDDVRVYNRPLSAEDVSRLAALKEPADAVEPTAAWQWSQENIGAEWSTVAIDITPFCKEATQYRIEFQKTGGKDDLEIRSVTAVFGGRRIEEYVERVGTGNTFVVTVPGLGIPLKLEAVVRGKGGRESSGRVFVSRAE